MNKETKLKNILVEFGKAYQDYLSECDVYDTPSVWSSKRTQKILTDLDNLDNWISVEKENKILISWLRNLHSKIMRFDEFKGLRGYPITHFVEKYLPKPPKE